MDTFEVINHITRIDAQRAMLAEKLAEMEANSVDATRFYAVAMTTDEVARFHRVSAATVRDYAKRKLIELHPDSTDAKMLFRASTVLTLDFSKLKRAKLESKR